MDFSLAHDMDPMKLGPLLHILHICCAHHMHSLRPRSYQIPALCQSLPTQRGTTHYAALRVVHATKHGEQGYERQ